MTEKEHSDLNEFLARHVMNLCVKDGRVYESRPRLVSPKPDKVENREISYDVPSYTTDPAAAMLVLEKCIRLTDVHFLPPQAVAPAIEIWGGGVRVTSPSPSLPLSICLFAKKLYGEL